MNRKRVKVAAYILVGAIAVSGTSVHSDAAGVSSLLPAAGLALSLEEGSSLEDVKASTKSAAASAEQEKKENLVNSFTKEMQDGSSAATKKHETETEIETEIKSSTEVEKEEAKKAKEASIIESIKNEKTETDSETESESETETEETDEETEELTKEEKAFSKLVIAKVNDYVNVRSIPSEDGEILGKLYDKSVGDFISEKNGWYRITSGTVTGYVKAEYCVTGEDAIELAKKVGTRVATVTTTTLKVRESASTSAPVLGLVPIDEELSVLEESDGWVKVDIEEGYGYVSSDYVSLRTDFVKAESKAEEAARLKKEEDAKKAAKEAAKKAEEKVNKERAEKAAKEAEQAAQSGQTESKPAPAPVVTSESDLGRAVVDYAMQFVGNPYVYGGSSLTNGTDCSGFVMSVYKNFGVSLPHSSSADRSQGYDVGGLENAQPGDIVCYSGHVGIYAGDGKLVHASTSKTGIIVSNANYRNVLAVRRIF